MVTYTAGLKVDKLYISQLTYCQYRYITKIQDNVPTHDPEQVETVVFSQPKAETSYLLTLKINFYSIYPMLS